MWRPCGALRAGPRAWAQTRAARAYGGGAGVSYTQGQSPEARTREYFYYVDHQGQVRRGAAGRGRRAGRPPRGVRAQGRPSVLSCSWMIPK